jgi:uncharacterized membrane protein YjfL (UPF0719 family)
VQSILEAVLAQVDLTAVPGQGASSSLFRHLVAALIFSLFGVFTLALCVWIMGRLSPFSLVKEIEEDHNTAAAIVMGAVLLGMSIIIAAAIVG